MTKTMEIKGMMCEHCEARVKKALEAIDGVESAVASHEANNAILTLSKDVDDAVLTKAVVDQDYEVVSVKQFRSNCVNCSASAYSKTGRI